MAILSAADEARRAFDALTKGVTSGWQAIQQKVAATLPPAPTKQSQPPSWSSLQQKVNTQLPPVQNLGDNLNFSFWHSPVGTGLMNVQKFIESPISIDLPKLPTFMNPQIKTPVGNIQPVQLARDIANVPFSFAANTASDIAQNIGRTIGGRELASYQNVKSPATRLGYNIGGAINPQSATQYGVQNTPQQIIGNTAGTIEGPLSVYGGGKVLGIGKNALEQAGQQTFFNTIKSQALSGAKYSGLFGLLNGLSEGRDKELLPQFLGSAQEAAMGAGAGLVLGGTLGTAGHTIGSLKNKLSEILQTKHDMNPQQADQAIKEYARNIIGQFTKEEPKTSSQLKQGVNDFVRQKTGKLATEPVYYGDLNEALGLPRSFNAQSGMIDFGAKLENPLRKSKPGDYTNVREIDNPLLLGKDWQSKQGNLPMETISTVTKHPQAASDFTDWVNRKPIDVKTKVNVLDYLRTPDRVLEKIGLKNHSDFIRSSYENYQKELPGEINKITQWSKQVSPSSNQRIFQYLDGQGVKLNATEQPVANEIKDYLKGWADKLGLPEDRRITNYITHIFEKDAVGKEFDPEFANLIKDKVAGSVYDPFVEQRLGKRGYIEDTWRALDAYTKRAVRKVNMDPALEKIKEASTNLEDSQFNYVKRYIDRVNMRPMELDNLIDNQVKQLVGYRFGQRPVTAATQNLRQAVYRGTLGLNPASALKNLTQGANTYARLGEKYTIIGYTNLAKSILSHSDELEKVGVLRDDFIQDRTINATRKFWEKTDKGLFAFFEGAERINRGSAYFGAKAKALSQGMSEEKAIEYAKKIVRDTQFSFGSVDTPVAMQGDIAKTVGQFQSYNLKQAEFLAEMIKNKEFAGLARFGLANTVLLLTIGQAIGMKPQDMIPFSSVVTGDTKLGQTPPIKLAGDVVASIFGAKDQFGNQPTFGDRVKTIGGDLVPFIPAGVQAKKTIEAGQAMREGASFSPSGQIRFEVPPSVKPLIFGLWSTKEAQDYLQKRQGENLSPEEKGAQAFNQQLSQQDAETSKVAGKMYLQLKGLKTPEERKALLDVWQQQGLLNADTRQAIKTLKERNQHVNEGNNAKAIRMIPTNKARATYLASLFKNKTPQERHAILQELQASKLLTSDLREKLLKLRKQ